MKSIPLSNFVYPAYFEAFHTPHSMRFDQMGAVSKPFEVLKDGYQIIFDKGKWSKIFGSKAKEEAFGKEDRKQHRSEQRLLKTLERSKSRSARRAA